MSNLCAALVWYTLCAGNKNGPCGPYSNASFWGKAGVTTLKPGPITLSWQVQAPGIALLLEMHDAPLVGFGLTHPLPHELGRQGGEHLTYRFPLAHRYSG